MQTIIMYAIANSTLGVVRDYANAAGKPAPTFTRGFPVLLKLRLFSTYEEPVPYSVSLLAGVASWQAVFDRDFSQSTTPILMADNSDIAVSSVTEEINDTEYTFTEIRIPIPHMNTEELVSWLGSNESMSGLHLELVGFDGSGNEVFGLQIKNFTIRNRIYYTGTPTEIPQDYLTAAQMRALVAAGVQLQYSADGASWHDVQGDDDTYFRVRSASDAQAIWSAPIAIPAGGGGGGTGIGAGKITINTSDPSMLANSGVDVYVDWDYWWVNWPRVPGYYGDHIEDAPVAGETSAGWFFVSVVMRASYSSSADYKATYTVGIRFTSQYLPQDFPGTAKHVVLAKVYWDGEKYTEVEQWFFGSDIRFLLAAEWYHGPFAVLNTNHVVTLLGGKLICGGTEYSVQDQQLTISGGDRFVYAYLDTSGATPSAGVSVASSLPASSATMQVQPIAQVTYMNQYRITQIWQEGYIRFDSGVSGAAGGSSDVIVCATSADMTAACTADNVGKVCLYIGETNASYTKGHHYEISMGAGAFTATSSDDRAAGTYTANGSSHTYNGVAYPDYVNENGTVLYFESGSSKLQATTVWDSSKQTGTTISNANPAISSLEEWPSKLATGSAVTFMVNNVSLFTLEVTFSYAAGGAEFVDLDSALDTLSASIAQTYATKAEVAQIPIITVDSAISYTSTNPLQNKVIVAQLNDKARNVTVNAISSRVNDCETALSTLSSKIATEVDAETRTAQNLVAPGATGASIAPGFTAIWELAGDSTLTVLSQSSGYYSTARVFVRTNGHSLTVNGATVFGDLATALFELAVKWTPFGATATVVPLAPATGTLTVTYSGTAPSGAQWSVDSGDTWHDFGEQISLAAGSYTIAYKAVSGYIVPSSQSATVTAGETTSVTAGAYTAPQNQFVVSYTVSGASDATANGGYWQDSSHTGRSNSPVWTNGTYYLTYGWDGDMDDPGWAITTTVPNGTNSYNQTPQYWVVSADSSLPPTSGWRNGVTVTQGS